LCLTGINKRDVTFKVIVSLQAGQAEFRVPILARLQVLSRFSLVTKDQIRSNNLGVHWCSIIFGDFEELTDTENHKINILP